MITRSVRADVSPATVAVCSPSWFTRVTSMLGQADTRDIRRRCGTMGRCGGAGRRHDRSALALLVLGAAFWFGTAATTSDDAAPGAGRRRPHRPADPATLYRHRRGDARLVGAAAPAGFLGLSLEYSALEAYTGAEPRGA